MVSANMEVPVRGTANFLPFQGGAQRLLREDGRDRWVALIPPPFSKRWAGAFGHRPFALPRVQACACLGIDSSLTK